MLTADNSPLSVLSLIKRAQLAARTSIDAALQRYGVSAAQFAVLRRLAVDPGLAGAGLARRCYVTAQTMSKTLALLEQASLVERFADVAHPNLLRARLTAAGEDTATACEAAATRVAERALVGLRADERVLFEAFLARCADALERPAARPAGRQPVRLRRVAQATGTDGDGARAAESTPRQV